jgi:HEAT repeats
MYVFRFASFVISSSILRASDGTTLTMNSHLNEMLFSGGAKTHLFLKSSALITRNARTCSSLVCAALLCACGSIDSATKLQSPDANTRMDALLKAGESGNEKTVPQIVPALQSEDPLVRWAAQQSLQKLTGTTLGYGWSDSPSKRAQATQKWVLWCKDKNLSTLNAS